MKLSVIMPIYNGGKNLEKAIESVIQQKNVNIELLIIDGGSKDNTNDIVKKYNNYIDYYVSEPDKGYSDALNKGILVATGDYVMMLAADDYFIDGGIEKALQSLHDDTDVWCGSIIRKTNYGIYVDKSDHDLNQLYRKCSLRHPATIFKTSVLKAVNGYDISYRCGADREIFLRLYTNGYKFQVEDINITCFTVDGMSQTSLQPFIDDKNISVKYGISEEQAEINYDHDVSEFSNKFLFLARKLFVVLNAVGILLLTHILFDFPKNYIARKIK